MTRQATTGFENGSADEYNARYSAGGAGDTITVESGGRTGTYRFRASGREPAYGKPGIYWNVTATDEFYVSFGFRTGASNQFNGRRFFVWRFGSADLGALYAKPTGVLRIEIEGGLSWSSVNVWPAQEWHMIELHIKIHDTLGVAQLRVDGNLWIDQSNVDTQSGAYTQMDRFWLLCYSDGSNLRTDNWFDDLAFNDIAGLIDNGWAGDIHLEPLLPNAPGDLCAWSLFPNTGEAAWQDVDDVPPNDDTDYLYDSVDGNQFLVHIQNWVATGKSLSKVHVKGTVRKESAVGADQVRLISKQGGITVVGGAQALLTTYELFTLQLDTAPDGGFWTGTKLNDLQIGAEVENVP